MTAPKLSELFEAAANGAMAAVMPPMPQNLTSAPSGTVFVHSMFSSDDIANARMQAAIFRAIAAVYRQHEALDERA